MRLCVLDTDHLSLLQRGHSQVAAKVLATPPEFLALWFPAGGIPDRGVVFPQV